jgi:hypothetical protein
VIPRLAFSHRSKNNEEIVLPDGRHYQAGYDGAVACPLHPRTGARVFRDDEARSGARDADMYYPARILDYFSTMSVVDAVEFEGHTCYHLQGTNNRGQVNEHFYDSRSGLLAGYRFNSQWRGGSGNESETFSGSPG